MRGIAFSRYKQFETSPDTIDKVQHRRLQYKLNWYSIRGSTHTWIQNFLQGRSQRVVSEGSQSSHILSSGVPQGTVLGPILFFLYTSMTSPTKPSIVQSVSLLMIASSTAASEPNAIPPFCKLTLILQPNGNSHLADEIDIVDHTWNMPPPYETPTHITIRRN